eukprot:TRINITY_DN3250_c0_g1_i1.p1 TRINITY_DN3250_c0_g1~~TRINITY_DN3250_c0_g1_i1.p1  ORF type:complete len:223 (+),score=59.02 TRINITY_DN3250_c0_g1_i1:26-670(+)
MLLALGELLGFLVALSLGLPTRPAASPLPKELACSACWLLARQYGTLMRTTGESEATIQTSHRLGRDNKVPRKKWRESELRAYDVTERLCERSVFEGLDVHTDPKGDRPYLARGAVTRTGDGWPTRTELPRTLENWCSELRGEYEEQIEALVKREAGSKEFRKVVCKKLARACATLESPFPEAGAEPSAPPPPPEPAGAPPSDPTASVLIPEEL